MVEILDCRGKETLKVIRQGGDVAFEFYDENDNKIFSSWFQMKMPYAKTFNNIERVMEQFKAYLIQAKHV